MTSDNGEMPRRPDAYPVLGDKPQSPRAFAAVNVVKTLEENVLQFLDKLALDRELAVDGRRLAIGRTQIELGFMAINSAIFKPERVELPDGLALGRSWVVEREDSDPARPLYLAPQLHGEQWSHDPEKAMQFARQQDAVQMATALAFRSRTTMSGQGE